MSSILLAKMAEFIVSKLAYTKMLLHCAKYPHCSINGVMLAERNKNKEAKCIKFVDAIPLFHMTLSLVPMLEVALTQVDAYCQSNNLVIAGYYQANENFEDAQPNAIAYRIMEKIQSNHPDACLFMFDNQEIGSETEAAYKVYQSRDNKWKLQSDTSHTVEAGGIETALFLLQNRKFRSLVDFDNHLEDIALDWKNLSIDELVQHST